MENRPAQAAELYAAVDSCKRAQDQAGDARLLRLSTDKYLKQRADQKGTILIAFIFPLRCVVHASNTF